MSWSMTKPKRKKKQMYHSQEFQNIKGQTRERLKQERTKRGFTQKELAEMCGCTHTFISQLENGRANPSIDISILLEQILETSFFELFPDL